MTNRTIDANDWIAGSLCTSGAAHIRRALAAGAIGSAAKTISPDELV